MPGLSIDAVMLSGRPWTSTCPPLEKSKPCAYGVRSLVDVYGWFTTAGANVGEVMLLLSTVAATVMSTLASGVIRSQFKSGVWVGSDGYNLTDRTCEVKSANIE